MEEYDFNAFYTAIQDLRKLKSCTEIVLDGASGAPGMLFFSHEKTHLDSLRDNKTSGFHTHEFYEMIIHVGGKRKLLAESRLYCPKCGDAFVIGSDERHKGISDGDDLYDRYYIYISPLFSSCLPCGTAVINGLFKMRHIGENNLISPSEQDKKTIFRLLDEVEKVLDEDKISDDSKVHTNFAAFLRILEILRIYMRSSDVDGESRDEPLPPALRTVLEYMNESFKASKSENIEDIAHSFGMSSSYMSRLFKNYLGISPYKYLLSRRLAHATELLRSGATVTEACFDSGFSDVSHFIVSYKSAYGETPNTLSKRMRASRKDGTKAFKQSNDE